MLAQRGVDVVMPNDGRRRVDFSEGRIHNKSDHVVWWPKPKRVWRLIWAFACHLRECLNFTKTSLVGTLLKSKRIRTQRA